ncbi:MAG: 23S rRNA (adenine(2030)-N(6))-methyltransferase RlmJ [Beijerinckiaceae bacterium]
MNYRHVFHAGNFADVFKHALLVRILLYLNRKDAPWRVIDTHAGEGAYDLAREESSRTGEWREGIARLRDLPGGEAADLLAPFLDLVGECDGEGRPHTYPGSPTLAQRLARANDRLIFCEKHPDAFAALKRRFARDRRVKALDLDGWTALGAFVPPPERRGLVLVDPPFEAKDEFAMLARGFVAAFAKWTTGVYALWYPVKDPLAAAALWNAVRESGATRALRLELAIAPDSHAGLVRTGLIVVNPPWTLEAEARILLPELVRLMERAPGAGAHRVERFGD